MLGLGLGTIFGVLETTDFDPYYTWDDLTTWDLWDRWG